MDFPQLMTVAEVAVVLRVSKMTVYRMLESGELASHKIGRSFRVPRSSVEQMLGVQA